MPRHVEFAEAFSETAHLLGLTRPAGLCFSTIWRAAQAPCADDLTELLGMSRSNVSTALKELREWGLISRVRAPGDRKEYFAADPDPWVIAGTMLSAFQRRSLSAAVDRLFAAGAESGGDARAAALSAALSPLSEKLAKIAALPASDLAALTEAQTKKDDATGGKKKKKKRSKTG